MNGFKRFIPIMVALTAVFMPLSACATENGDDPDMNMTYRQYTVTLTVNGRKVTATMVANQATAELKSLLVTGNLSVSMRDYGGFEKVGILPRTFTRNDKPTTTSAGDIMLYQGNQIVIFYGSNSWDYTPLGKIDSMTASEIKSFLGSGSVTLEMSLGGDPSGISAVEADENRSETEYYNLSGVKVSEDSKGLLIVKTGNKIKKVWRQ